MQHAQRGGDHQGKEKRGNKENKTNSQHEPDSNWLILPQSYESRYGRWSNVRNAREKAPHARSRFPYLCKPFYEQL